MRPLGELDLDDELGLDPDDVALAHAWHLRKLGERRAGPLERPQPREEVVERLLREAGADVADPAEPAPLLHRQDERAEPGTATLALRVAGDDELLLGPHLHLQPVA
jgi:hypothetical protein